MNTSKRNYNVKTTSKSIRIDNSDMKLLRGVSIKEGLTIVSLIKMIIHKFCVKRYKDCPECGTPLDSNGKCTQPSKHWRENDLIEEK